MFHKNCNDNVDQHKLCHKHKDDKEDRRNDCADTTVANAVIGRITIFSQRILKKPVNGIESMSCDQTT